MIDSTISHYEILEKLAEGGMGVLYDDCAYGDYFEKSDYSNILLFGHGTPCPYNIAYFNDNK